MRGGSSVKYTSLTGWAMVEQLLEFLGAAVPLVDASHVIVDVQSLGYRQMGIRLERVIATDERETVLPSRLRQGSVSAAASRRRPHRLRRARQGRPDLLEEFARATDNRPSWRSLSCVFEVSSGYMCFPFPYDLAPT